MLSEVGSIIVLMLMDEANLSRRSSGLAESLRNELQLYGISVHLFLPATIFSPGFEKEQELKPEICKKIEGPDEGMSPEQVAAHMIRGGFDDSAYPLELIRPFPSQDSNGTTSISPTSPSATCFGTAEASHRAITSSWTRSGVWRGR